MKLPRVVIILGLLSAALIVTTVLSVLLLPWLIDSRLIRDKITLELAKKTEGSVSFGKIALRWFPQPTVVIHNAEISFGDKTQGSIRAATIHPSIFYLFTGRLVVRRALLEQPEIKISLPAASEKPFDLGDLEEQIRSVLVRLTTNLPAPRIDVSDGSAEIRIGDKPLTLENVEIQTAASPAEMRFEVSARSNLCERARIEGKISPDSLASRLDIGVQGLKVRESLSLLPLEISEYARNGEASFDVKMTSVGLRSMKASIDGFAGPFVFARHGGTATIDAKRLRGGITYEGDVFHLTVQQLELGSPRLQASGELKIQSGLLSTRIKVRDVDIGELSQVALQFVHDIERLKRIIRYIPAGTIPEINLQSAGRSIAEMVWSKNVSVSGSMHNGKIFLPGPDLEFHNVAGSVRISGGTLEASGVNATVGASKGWNGKLRLGLQDTAAPFRLEVSLHTSAPELHSVLLKVIRHGAFRAELLKVRDLDGNLSGRLILGERLNAISPVVAISNANFSASYEPIPFPITIRGGRLNYDRKIVTLEDAQGSVGLSTFRGLGMTLHHDGSRQIKVDSGQMFLDLHQADALLRSFQKSRSYFEKLQSVRGRVELRNFILSGAYDNPTEWTFGTAGRLDQVEITHADYPGRITLSRGKFDMNEGQITFSDAAAAMSDASLSGGGHFYYGKFKPWQLETSGVATIGVKMTQWLSRYVELPEELNLRSPLRVAAERLAWREGGNISFLGQATVADGPQLSLELVKQPHALALQHLTIDDGARRARMTFQFAEDHLGLSFSGEVTHQTIDKIFVAFPMKGSSLQGDIQASVARGDPIRVSARGLLSGSNLLIPLGTDKALIEKFNIEASGESVQLRSTDLLWGNSRLALSGKITGAKEFLSLDLDVTGDRLDWEDIERLFSRERRQKRSGAISIPDVEGTIRLKTDRFTFEGFNVIPVETTVTISPAAISTEIKRGVVCGISTTGRIEFVDKDIRLDLQLSATNAALEPATICLTKQLNDVTGTYSLTARITGRGDREHLRSALKGDFQLTARNGQFVRSPGIDATFDYLNATGDFKVAFPDLDKETFPYRFVGVKGRIEGKMLIGDEVNVNSSLLNLSGAGKVDLERQQIDGTGLIAVLKPVDEVISRIPVISSIVGGSLVGIPVRVTGSIERPDVTYLSPADVGAELLSIPLRILGVPLEAIRLFTPSGEQPDKNITK
ncbi:MAG TPA: AsmA-like C-terminal domain-containing protein [Candidatus Binatia bacterium]|nr:AsmA-like C-terminal domain-containing protein [Candidatus Binatia bacterium]